MRGIWIKLGTGVAVVLLAVVAVRIYQDRPQPQRWTVAGSPGERQVASGAESFKIWVDAGQCNPADSALGPIDVEESASPVTVTANVDPEGSPLAPSLGADDCEARLSAVVHLDAPLGSRELRAGDYPNWDPMH
jgi:hypothetical protein